MSGVSPTVTPVVTPVSSTSSPPTTSQPTPTAMHSGSTSLPTNPSRGPPQTRHQAAVSQGASLKLIDLSLVRQECNYLTCCMKLQRNCSVRKAWKRLA